MFNKNNTKRALLGSALALILCISMLVGTTFAWFTDSVTSAGNKIQAGNLDVELYLWNGANDTDKVAVSGMTESIFKAAQKAQKGTETLWEPGKTEVVYFSIKNNGSLDLKYKVALNVLDADGEQNLYEAMQYDIIENATYGTVTAWDGTNAVGVVPGINATQANDVALAADGEHFFALAIHMKEEAGNKYQGGQVDFDLKVLAAQLMSESDSFDNTYDEFAGYDGVGFAKLEDGATAAEVPVYDENNMTVGNATVPAGAFADPAKKAEATMLPSSYAPNITVDTGIETKTLDIKVSNIKENNTVPVKVTVFIGKGLDPDTVSVYHYDRMIVSSYNPNDGYVTFESTNFSPFTVAYDAESEYVPPVISGDIDINGDGEADVDGNGNGVVETDKPVVTAPKAKVVEKPEYVNTTLPWGSYGQWSPNTSVDADPKLEAAYEFSCVDNLDKAKESAFANWYCDFYVMLNTDLGENQIFLGGNYGSFGWVGFHNGDVTLKANEEIPLLGSVTSNPWTYVDVVQNVREFTCGVGDVNDALKGATFTVKLRLTNPENESQYIDVSTINYTFQ